MELARHQFLPRSALPRDEDRRLAPRDLAEPRPKRAHLGSISKEFATAAKRLIFGVELGKGHGTP